MFTLICGQSRAGKTTYSGQFENVIHSDYCSPQKVLRLLKQGTGDIVVEGIYATAHDRKKLLTAYRGEGSKCIWLDTPFSVRKERGGPMYRDVPFEPPSTEEGWDEIILIGE